MPISLKAAAYNAIVSELKRLKSHAEAVRRAAELWGGGCNEHGVFVDPKREILARIKHSTAVGQFVTGLHGLWLGTAEFRSKGGYSGGLPSVFTAAFDSFDDARQSVIAQAIFQVKAHGLQCAYSSEKPIAAKLLERLKLLVKTPISGNSTMPTRTLPTESLSLHPQSDLVPEMPPDQYVRFLADVKERGILDPIELLHGTRTVIEGRTRLRAAKDAQILAVPVVDADLRGESPVLYMLRAALLRRHLSKSQSAALAVELLTELKKQARERQRAGASKGGRAKVPEKVPEPSVPARKDRSGEAREQAAKAAGVNSKYVSDAEKVKAKAPEVFAQVKAGTLTISDAKKKANIETAAGPVVCKPISTLPLAEVPKFPAHVAAALDGKGVKTLADLERVADQVRADQPKRDLGKGLDTQVVYYAMKSLGVGHLDALPAGDAIIDLFKVDPMAASKPEKPTVKKTPAVDPTAQGSMPLKSCPFCGSNKLKVMIGSWLHVYCEDCMASGPRKMIDKARIDNELNAREAWNHRVK